MAPILDCTVTITLLPTKVGYLTRRVSREMLEAGLPVFKQYLLKEVEAMVAKLPAANGYQLLGARCALFDSPRTSDTPVAEYELLPVEA